MAEMVAIILAAGQGKRMHSKLPKVLHPILGRPLILFPLALARSVGCRKIVTVVGHGREAVVKAVQSQVGEAGVCFAHQEAQLGTGDAVMTALTELKGDSGPVLILSGDVPLLDEASVKQLQQAFNGTLAMITFFPDDPTGYGRIIRNKERPVAIREHRDCTREEQEIAECNAGIYLIDLAFLKNAVQKLTRNNDQNELYLTDLVAIAAKDGGATAVPVAPELVSGVNDRAELSAIESVLSCRRNTELMKSGVSMIAPETIRVEMGVSIKPDTTLMPSVHLIGDTEIGEGCSIGQGCIIKDTKVADGVTISAYSVIEGATIASSAAVGPMARLRPGAEIGPNAKIGNWVEVKNTKVGRNSKANHLTYLGDGEIGEGVNIGAGTIFCNYDGFSKHRTVLGNGVFIGSDSQLVAPITIGDGAYVASGTTVTEDVPPEALALSRMQQKNLENRATVLKKKLKDEKEKRLASAERSAEKKRAE